jgi:NADH-quinone oxidoreductase subunit G
MTGKPAIAEALRDIKSGGGAPAAAPATQTAGSTATAPAASPPPAPAAAPPAASGEAELITIKLDGRDVQVKKGTNVLEACLANGSDVSYFCYHQGLSSPAVCRQCLVEVNGQTKLVPSCYTPVAERMEVVTSSPRVLQARQQMLEFTLVNHPVDCPICDKAGECDLQRLYVQWDHSKSRTEFEKVHKPKMVDLGPTIVLDAERCILCTRCIRVCDEVAGQHQLEMAWRGDREQLSVAPGQVLDNPYSLNTVDVCPVGALTSKDFRFTMRAWELYTTPSVCAGCATGCNIEVHHSQGEIWRLVPRENQDVNKFWMCDEGRFTYKEVRHRRHSGTRIGSGKGLPAQATSVDKGVAFAAERLRRVAEAGGVIGLCFGAQADNESLYALRRVAEELEKAGAKVRRYAFGRRERPDRADKILRHADVNPNTRGALAMAGAEARDFAALKADLKSGALKAVWMVGEDVPVGDDTLPEVASLFDGLEVFVVQAVHDSPLVRRAHAQLPAAAWAEIDGTFVNVKGMVQRIRRAVAPHGDARSHLELLTQIARKAGWVEAEKWQSSARQAFLHMVGQMSAAPAASNVAAPAIGFAHAEWGRELQPIQLRFANSRG